MIRLLYAASIVVLFWSMGGRAADAQNTITIKGTIQEATCDVTGMKGESTLIIDFGLVSLELVGTAQAEQSIQLKVSCDSPASAGKVLKMFVTPGSGILTTVGQNVLGTSMNGLGIALTSGDSGVTPVNLNKWVPVVGINTSVDEPVGEVDLKGRLVKASPGVLQAGVFTSTANIIMNYQ